MKSYVSVEQHQCIVCGATYDTGTVLLDRKLRTSLEHKTVTGTGMCDEHKKMRDDGYIALVEVDDQRRYLGRIVHVRSSVWPNIFNIPVPDGGVAFVDAATMNLLEKKAEV